MRLVHHTQSLTNDEAAPHRRRDRGVALPSFRTLERSSAARFPSLHASRSCHPRHDQHRLDARYADAISPSPEVVAWSGRVVIVALGVLLGVLLWITARRMFSEGAANFALALFAFSPSLIANFSISCNDGATALDHLRRRDAARLLARTQSWGRAVGLGLLLGAMLATKFSLPAMFVLALGLVLILKPTSVAWNPHDWNWRQAIAMVAISLFFVWGTYFFHVTKVEVKNGFVTVTSPNRTKATTGDTHKHINLTAYIPAGEYIEGMGRVANHLNLGHPTYFLGQISHDKGWKAYFPTVVALKWPPVVLALFLAAIALGIAGRIKFPTDLLIFALFPAFYFLLAIFSKVDLGERHILLVYPFALLFIASLWKYAQKKPRHLRSLPRAARRQRRRRPSLRPRLSLVLHAFRESRDELEAAQRQQPRLGPRPARAPQLPGSNTRTKPSTSPISAPSIPSSTASATLSSHPNEHVTGTVVVSATNLSGQLLDDPNGYHWLLQYPAKILDHSLYVFEVPADAK